MGILVNVALTRLRIGVGLLTLMLLLTVGLLGSNNAGVRRSCGSHSHRAGADAG